MKIDPPKRGKGEMLPLMDMIFLLMVMFIFMMIEMRPDFGVAVELPDVGEKADSGLVTKDKKFVVLTIDKQNNFYVNKDKVAFKSLSTSLSSAHKKHAKAKVSVIIKGDKKSEYGSAIQLFSFLRKEGYKDIMFDVEGK